MTSLLSRAIHSCTTISVYPSLTYTEEHTCTVFFPDIDINFNMMLFKGLIHAKSYQYGLSGTKNHFVLSASSLLFSVQPFSPSIFYCCPSSSLQILSPSPHSFHPSLFPSVIDFFLVNILNHQ